jgi:arsenate reductase
LLRENGVEPEIVEYLKDPPSAAELDATLRMLRMEPRELMRSKEKEYRDLGLKDPSLSRDQLIAAMAEHPRLIERPVAFSGDRAVLGRPTEKVLELL